MFNSNFDELHTIEGQGIRVTGSSSAIADASLVMRRVILRQGAAVVEGKTDFGIERWQAAPALPAVGFAEGPAIALGAEVYFVDGPDSTPGYVWFTWSQNVRLEKS